MDERPIPTIGATHAQQQLDQERATTTGNTTNKGGGTKGGTKNDDDGVFIRPRFSALCNHDVEHAFGDVERDLRDVRETRTDRAQA